MSTMIRNFIYNMWADWDIQGIGTVVESASEKPQNKH